MRIDAITIFPDYFNALELSLLGKAREKELLEVRIHDLRDYTHDKHKTVDDSPYGGGAGMLMKPEPWGEAFDEILDADGDSIVIFTSRPASYLSKPRQPNWPMPSTSSSPAVATRASTSEWSTMPKLKRRFA